jgi:hypothetical protein
MPDITTQAITRAIHDLHERTGKWPTRDQLVAYLCCEISMVKNGLAELRRRRIMRDRRREGETRWMPWSEL